ncbi:cytochrome c peroxidase [Pricia sp. S334]|uniref:Cytochrome c peroxidase n=1 Tax=Pricia mediterranea TaxID=3076079 RepID=A0ABU3L519_9FLAO|nr:cytochrome c peroxidase [Pricia sp. S334]MDT7828309.1 cytochrome c peroxidase [Pricia sp. S334]
MKKPRVVTRLTALPEQAKSPKDNPTTPEKELLGRLLFYDPILSGGKDVACATCHHPDNGYAEFLDISIGPNAQGLGSKRRFNPDNDIPFMKRNAPTIINTAFNGIDPYGRHDPETASMFWDDRAKSLELQALEPIKAFEEMRGHGHGETDILRTVIERLKKIPAYQELFTQAFGNSEAVSIDNLGKAIAAFERTIIANNSRFDQYMRGDKDAISLSEKEGLKLFKSVGCINCHNGPMFSDYKMHVLGVPENDKLAVPDAGVQDTFAFRTPSLRNLRFTAPYMHNGSLSNLRRVLEFYEDISDGKERNANVPKGKYDPFVREIELSVKEMSQIISFLGTLNDNGFDREIPDTVPSGLPVGGNIN